MLSLRVVSTVSHQNMQPLLLSKFSVAKQQRIYPKQKSQKIKAFYFGRKDCLLLFRKKKYFSWILCLFVCLDYLFICLEKK